MSGPAVQFKLMLSPERRAASLTLFFFMIATLVTSFLLGGIPFFGMLIVLICGCLEILALGWYLAKVVPGGEKCMKACIGCCKKGGEAK